MIRLDLPEPPRPAPVMRPAPAPKARRSYDMGRVDRLTMDWVRAPMSPNRELDGSVKTIKARSRDLAKNTFFGRNFQRLYRQSVIGPHGIALQMRLGAADGQLNEADNAAIELAWKAWSQPGQCTTDRRMSLVDLLRLLADTYVTDGEILLELLPGFGNPFGFAVRPWDTDLLDPDFHRRDPGKPEIIASVEYDEFGREVAYHLLTRHMDESGITPKPERIRFPADRMVFVARRSRAGQTRGVPEFTAIGGIANQLIGYWEAEVVAARMAAATMGFLQQDADGINPDAPGEVTVEGAPGLMQRLAPGESFVPWNPDHPTTAFPEFSKALLRGIASGLGVSYAALCADPSEANYSSARFASVPERDKWRDEQRVWAEQVMRRIFAAWLPQAVLTGNLQLSINRLDEILMGVQWQPRGFPYINPQEDMAAAETALRLNLTTVTALIAERGGDIVDVLAERKRERDMMQAMGLEDTPDEPGADAGDGANRAPAGGNRAGRD